jgi:hypothetical protein
MECGETRLPAVLPCFAVRRASLVRARTGGRNRGGGESNIQGRASQGTVNFNRIIGRRKCVP